MDTLVVRNDNLFPWLTFSVILVIFAAQNPLHLLVSKLAPFPDFDPVIVTQFSAPSDHVRINDKGLARTYYSTTVYEPILMAN